jgi:hypothetical protein
MGDIGQAAASWSVLGVSLLLAPFAVLRGWQFLREWF